MTDFDKYGWSDPPHKLHHIVYKTDDYTISIVLKLYSLDNIEIDSLEILPAIKTMDWNKRKQYRKGVKLTEEDQAIEQNYPYLMAEGKTE